jgi:hypothetical protein
MASWKKKVKKSQQESGEIHVLKNNSWEGPIASEFGEGPIASESDRVQKLISQHDLKYKIVVIRVFELRSSLFQPCLEQGAPDDSGINMRQVNSSTSAHA